jgi:thioesterase domain-containing protein/acyl carrier protein
VKFHGFRIELGEIGEALNRHAAVKEAAVLLDETGGEQFLVAYVATQAGGARTDDLKSFLRAALPEYMVPARFVFLEALPRTPNGKVDRRALPETDHSPNPQDRQFIEARTDMEFALKEIWQRLLDVRPIGITDNYFDLGGHSLLAIRLFSEIHDAFGIELPLATILRAPTIESLARVILEGGKRDQRATLVTITPTGQRPPMFCVGPMEGEVILFRKLALELGNDQPLYGLQPFAMANRTSLLSSIEEIAGHYVEQIRSSGRRAHCLLGYSLGGVVALEMAQQLRSSGEDVPLVVLIDTHYPAVCRSEESWEDRWRRYRYHLRHLASRAGLEYLAERTRIRSLRILRKVASVAGTAPIAAPDVLHAQWLAGEAYRAKPYPGRVCLFRAESRSEFLHGGPSLGWNGVLSDLTIEEIPGDHGTIYTGNNLQLLARFLEGQLESCFAGVR